jgi:hypothetical protein
MDRASLDRYVAPHGGNRHIKSRSAIDDEELGPPQATLDEIVENSAPG